MNEFQKLASPDAQLPPPHKEGGDTNGLSLQTQLEMLKRSSALPANENGTSGDKTGDHHDPARVEPPTGTAENIDAEQKKAGREGKDSWKPIDFDIERVVSRITSLEERGKKNPLGTDQKEMLKRYKIELEILKRKKFAKPKETRAGLRRRPNQEEQARLSKAVHEATEALSDVKGHERLFTKGRERLERDYSELLESEKDLEKKLAHGTREHINGHALSGVKSRLEKIRVSRKRIESELGGNIPRHEESESFKLARKIIAERKNIGILSKKERGFHKSPSLETGKYERTRDQLDEAKKRLDALSEEFLRAEKEESEGTPAQNEGIKHTAEETQAEKEYLAERKGHTPDVVQGQGVEQQAELATEINPGHLLEKTESDEKKSEGLITEASTPNQETQDSLAAKEILAEIKNIGNPQETMVAANDTSYEKTPVQPEFDFQDQAPSEAGALKDESVYEQVSGDAVGTIVNSDEAVKAFEERVAKEAGEKTHEELHKERTEAFNELFTKKMGVLNEMKGEAQARTERTGWKFAAEALGRTGEKWNAFKKEHKFGYAAALILAGSGGFATGTIFAGGALTATTAVLRALSGVGVFYSKDKQYEREAKEEGRTRTEREVGADRLKAMAWGVLMGGLLGHMLGTVAHEVGENLASLDVSGMAKGVTLESAPKTEQMPDSETFAEAREQVWPRSEEMLEWKQTTIEGGAAETEAHEPPAEHKGTEGTEHAHVAAEYVPGDPKILEHANQIIDHNMNQLFGTKGIFGLGAKNWLETLNMKDPEVGFANKSVNEIMDVKLGLVSDESVAQYGIRNDIETEKMQNVLKKAIADTGVSPMPNENSIDFLRRATSKNVLEYMNKG